MCFLWVCGILAHQFCSSQVTALFSRTYLAFFPRHDYHTPSSLEWLCGIFPSFQVELQRLSRTPPLFRFLPLLLLPRTPRVQPFPPLSQLFVSADVIGSLGRDVSSMTSRQRGVRECVREGLHLNSPKLIAHVPFFLSFIGSDMKEQNRCN